MKDHILIADDDPDIISGLRYLLETEGYQVSSANSPQEVLVQLPDLSPDLLLMDLNYSQDTTSGSEGLDLLARVRETDNQLPMVVMTAWGSIESAVEAMRLGAQDYVQKPWENDRLLAIIQNQIKLRRAEETTLRLTEENQLLREQISFQHQTLIAHSPIMSALLEQLQQVASSDANLLLTGENGTGKSFLVEYIHGHSSRAEKPLISVNMGSITETLFESEMFGHVKGAYTDAKDNRIGRFELADEGTLFLDEIGNTPISQQAKLLRVLEEHQFEKVGSSRTQNSDCRLICATNTDLDAAVTSGSFRKDLLYRINTVTLHVPSLRQRKEDIVALAEFFLEKQSRHYGKSDLKFSGEAKIALQNYDWPGNVRELSHVVERATILSPEKSIKSAALGLNSLHDELTINANIDSSSTLDEITRSVIAQRLEEHAGNGLKAAESLGLSKSAFYRHLKKYNL